MDRLWTQHVLFDRTCDLYIARTIDTITGTHARIPSVLECQTRLWSNCSWFGRPTRKAGRLGPVERPKISVEHSHISATPSMPQGIFYVLIIIDTAPRSHSFHFNYVQCCCCNLRILMPCSTPRSKVAGRGVFANCRLRPTIDQEEFEPANEVAGHDHAEPPPRSKLSTSMIGLMATRADPTFAQSDTSPSLSDSISSSDDPGHQVPNHRRYETGSSH